MAPFLAKCLHGFSLSTPARLYKSRESRTTAVSHGHFPPLPHASSPTGYAHLSSDVYCELHNGAQPIQALSQLHTTDSSFISTTMSPPTTRAAALARSLSTATVESITTTFTSSVIQDTSAGSSHSSVSDGPAGGSTSVQLSEDTMISSLPTTPTAGMPTFAKCPVDTEQALIEIMKKHRNNLKFPLHGTTYYGVRLDDIDKVRSSALACCDVVARVKMAEDLCLDQRQQQALKAVSDFKKYVAGLDWHAFRRGKCGIAHAHRAIARLIAAFQGLYDRDDNRKRELSLKEVSNESRRQRNKFPSGILLIYLAYEEDNTVVENLTVQITGFLKVSRKTAAAPPKGNASSAASKIVDSDDGSNTLLSSCPNTRRRGPSSHVSSTSANCVSSVRDRSAETRPSLIVKLPYEIWKLFDSKTLRKLATICLRDKSINAPGVKLIAKLVSDTKHFPKVHRTYLNEELLPYVVDGSNNVEKRVGLAAILGFCELIRKYPSFKILANPAKCPENFEKLCGKGFYLLKPPGAERKDRRRNRQKAQHEFSRPR